MVAIFILFLFPVDTQHDAIRKYRQVWVLHHHFIAETAKVMAKLNIYIKLQNWQR